MSQPSRELRVLVAGGRDFDDADSLQIQLYGILLYANRHYRKLVIAHGAAEGADMIADDWGNRQSDVEVRRYPVRDAERARLGNMAPHRRNVRMLEDFEPHLALLCPGANGTAHMRAKLEAARVPIITLTPERKAAA